jgi:hypothetical protein
MCLCASVEEWQKDFRWTKRTGTIIQNPVDSELQKVMKTLKEFKIC